MGEWKIIWQGIFPKSLSLRLLYTLESVLHSELVVHTQLEGGSKLEQATWSIVAFIKAPFLLQCCDLSATIGQQIPQVNYAQRYFSLCFVFSSPRMSVVAAVFSFAREAQIDHVKKMCLPLVAQLSILFAV